MTSIAESTLNSWNLLPCSKWHTICFIRLGKAVWQSLIFSIQRHPVEDEFITDMYLALDGCLVWQHLLKNQAAHIVPRTQLESILKVCLAKYIYEQYEQQLKN